MRHTRMKAPARQIPAPASRIVDLNSADVKEIANVPGVGPRIADAIVARRPLRGWDDLKELPGMSQGLMKQLRNSGVRIGAAIRGAGNP